MAGPRPGDPFWEALDRLLAEHPVRIDRPRGSIHPRYPDFTYPFDYGYLEGTTAGDGSGIDVWIGSMRDRTPTAVICCVDLEKRDAELKVLIGCTREEIDAIVELHNDGVHSAIPVLRDREVG